MKSFNCQLIYILIPFSLILFTSIIYYIKLIKKQENIKVLNIDTIDFYKERERALGILAFICIFSLVSPSTIFNIKFYPFDVLGFMIFVFLNMGIISGIKAYYVILKKIGLNKKTQKKYYTVLGIIILLLYLVVHYILYFLNTKESIAKNIEFPSDLISSIVFLSPIFCIILYKKIVNNKENIKFVNYEILHKRKNEINNKYGIMIIICVIFMCFLFNKINNIDVYLIRAFLIMYQIIASMLISYFLEMKYLNENKVLSSKGIRKYYSILGIYLLIYQIILNF